MRQGAEGRCVVEIICECWMWAGDVSFDLYERGTVTFIKFAVWKEKIAVGLRLQIAAL